MAKKAAGIPPELWVWHGHVGHHICGAWMRFHMLTEVGNYLISTIGEMVTPGDSGGSERAEAEWLRKNFPGRDVGLGRKYETYVFPLGLEVCKEKDCGCNARQPSNWSELAGRGSNTRGDARNRHMELCREYAEMQPMETTAFPGKS
jgi:hypothetical protein